MVSEIEKIDRSLIPPFAEGEYVEIHRDVNGERVIIIARAREASSLGPHNMHLAAQVRQWGVSPHADGRVARQAESINRLLSHLQNHCADSDCPHRIPATSEPGPVTILGEGIFASTPEPEEGTVINWRGMNFVMQREGTNNGTIEGDSDTPASPVRIIGRGEPGSGYQA